MTKVDVKTTKDLGLNNAKHQVRKIFRYLIKKFKYLMFNPCCVGALNISLVQHIHFHL
jgi:hypothetical protein